MFQGTGNSTRLQTRSFSQIVTMFLSYWSRAYKLGAKRSKLTPHRQSCTTSYRTKTVCRPIGRKPLSFDWTVSKSLLSATQTCGCYTTRQAGDPSSGTMKQQARCRPSPTDLAKHNIFYIAKSSFMPTTFGERNGSVVSIRGAIVQ
jgi:hypothetical protein